MNTGKMIAVAIVFVVAGYFVVGSYAARNLEVYKAACVRDLEKDDTDADQKRPTFKAMNAVMCDCMGRRLAENNGKVRMALLTTGLLGKPEFVVPTDEDSLQCANQAKDEYKTRIPPAPPN